MKTVLITGGTGFIGSHTCINLIENNFRLIIVDSNINSSIICLERLKKLFIEKSIELEKFLFFFKGDIRDKDFLNNVFLNCIKNNQPIEAVIHFAGLKSVQDSIINPLLYWNNNVLGSLNLFEIMDKYLCNTLVFSSSATVYGNTSKNPIFEYFPLKPENPYGQSKAAIESILESMFKSSPNKWKIANLRYFNPIGAHQSGLIGEDPKEFPKNLFPIICRVADCRNKHLKIFGKDWPTKDGTAVRDYIHVMDLADAHRCSLDFLFRNQAQFINFNIGTGFGTSVLELLNIFMETNECHVNYRFYERRVGDSPILFANNQKAINLLNWNPQKSLIDMCRDGWNWQKINPKGYG